MSDDTDFFLRTSHLGKKVQSGDSQITILRDINLSIKKGESVAILGASGSGKTTLLTLLGGLDLPTTGDIFFENYHLNALNEEQRAQLRAKSVGFIFQSFHLLPSLTALENVMLPLEIQYIPHHQAVKQAKHALNQVGLSERLSHYPNKLSGGEQQRVAIARAFVSPRKIIFADEMTGNLDTHTGERVTDILFSLNQEYQITLVLVTHDDMLAKRCEKRFLLHEGVLQPC